MQWIHSHSSDGSEEPLLTDGAPCQSPSPPSHSPLTSPHSSLVSVHAKVATVTTNSNTVASTTTNNTATSINSNAVVSITTGSSIPSSYGATKEPNIIGYRLLRNPHPTGAHIGGHLYQNAHRSPEATMPHDKSASITPPPSASQPPAPHCFTNGVAPGTMNQSLSSSLVSSCSHSEGDSTFSTSTESSDSEWTGDVRWSDSFEVRHPPTPTSLEVGGSRVKPQISPSAAAFRAKKAAHMSKRKNALGVRVKPSPATLDVIENVAVNTRVGKLLQTTANDATNTKGASSETVTGITENGESTSLDPRCSNGVPTTTTTTTSNTTRNSYNQFDSSDANSDARKANCDNNITNHVKQQQQQQQPQNGDANATNYTSGNDGALKSVFLRAEASMRKITMALLPSSISVGDPSSAPPESPVPSSSSRSSSASSSSSLPHGGPLYSAWDPGYSFLSEADHDVTIVELNGGLGTVNGSVPSAHPSGSPTSGKGGGPNQPPQKQPQLNRYTVDSSLMAIRETDEKLNTFICAVYCVITIAVIIGLVVLLYQYSEEARDDHSQNYDKGDIQEVHNLIYRRKTASVIRKAAEFHDDHLRLLQWTENPELFRNKSPTLVGKLRALQREHLERDHLKEDLKWCAEIPPSFVGSISEEVNLTQPLSINEVLENNTDVQEGGEWRPPDCVSRHRVAIIIPYRDRWAHLKVLLYHLVPMLKRQQIHFRIFVVEQFGNDTFNKGLIMNAAFREAIKIFDFQCVTFHDVDLVPEDDRNMYSCSEQPKHMSVAIDKFSYILPYEGLVGGVLSLQASHFQLVNGYSNMYWGWGAEDDDMTVRIMHRGLRVYRPPAKVARYKMVKHDQRKINAASIRMKLLRSAARRSKLEGLNNVKYKLVFTHTEKLFTHFMVDIGKK